MSDRYQVIEKVEDYWRQAGLASSDVAEMKAELRQHLVDAESEGHTVTEVVGDTAIFAETWAEARRGRPVATWNDVQSGNTKRRRESRRDLVLFGIGTMAVVAAAAVSGQGGNNLDNEVWRWLWTVFAIIMGVGEVFTAGFFLLPFAVGAASAAILAWVGAAVIAQWLVFFGVSLFSLAYLRRYIGRQDEGEQPRVGANRWIGSEGMVLETIDPHTGRGMVRILNEEWRAAANQPIEAGQRILVTEVEGTRLFVERLAG